MKQALVLGLALAANAMTADQVDNELIVAPTGGKLGDLTKFPGKMGRIMFDEQVDDELLAMNTYKPREETKHDMWLKMHPEFRHENLYKPYYKIADDEELFVAPEGKYGELVKKYPGMIKFDQQADDELLRLRSQLPGETAAQYQGYLQSKRKHFARDDAADEELFVAPQGKLADLAKKYPGMIMFDEQADDELLIRPLVKADDDEFIVMLLPREHFKTEEEYQKYVAKMRFHRDDEELFVAPEGKLGEFAKKYPGKIMFDEQADDELRFEESKGGMSFLNRPRPQIGSGSKPKPREESKMTEAYVQWLKKQHGLTNYDDDELLAMNTYKPREESKHAMFLKNHPEMRPYYYSPYYKIADDEELFVAPEGRLGEFAKKYPGKIMFDEQADDELIAMIPPRNKFQTEEEYRKFVDRIRKSGSLDDADDELLLIPVRPKVFSDKGLVKPAKVATSEALVRDDEADDELLLIPVRPKVFNDKGLVKPAKVATSEALVRDDEGDDELVYLGHLIRHAENEKPAYIKAHLKTELPKKRKMRPVDETA